MRLVSARGAGVAAAAGGHPPKRFQALAAVRNKPATIVAVVTLATLALFTLLALRVL